ncbi:sideroflexin-2-like [Tubulanus polymorphus]|uniref:sideroflexin-2-like n=1 Tax=Tubulanus polymorphus TaxID=672921 RepID=UPI003DA1CF6B
MTENRINVDGPLWDQSTFLGRLKHFAWMTDFRTVVVRESKLHEAKDLVDKYRIGLQTPGVTKEEVIYAKKLYDSSFHPDSGELQNVFGRMSFQVPGGMSITGAMITFYRTNTAVIFWQWVNQSFNALVNYTNRNAESDIDAKRIAIAYTSATTSAVVTALGLKAILAKSAGSLMQRFVPFAAVAAANMVNIPLMRQSELIDGIVVSDENGNKITQSRYAAVKGISQVVLSRIFMATPTMLGIPVVMEYLERYPVIKRMTWTHAPIQVFLCGVVLCASVPIGCALFPQRSCITVDKLRIMDKDKYDELVGKFGDSQLPERLYFNKGL